jgi:hypothetical protein
MWLMHPPDSIPISVNILNQQSLACFAPQKKLWPKGVGTHEREFRLVPFLRKNRKKRVSSAGKFDAVVLRRIEVVDFTSS